MKVLSTAVSSVLMMTSIWWFFLSLSSISNNILRSQFCHRRCLCEAHKRCHLGCHGYTLYTMASWRRQLLDRSSQSSFQHSQIGSPDVCCSTRGEVNAPLRLQGKFVLKRKKTIKEENAEEGKRRPVVSFLFNSNIFSLLEARNVNIRCDMF